MAGMVAAAPLAAPLAAYAADQKMPATQTQTQQMQTQSSGTAQNQAQAVRPADKALLALLAGILVVPRVLNYVVAVYLILIGLIGTFPHLLG